MISFLEETIDSLLSKYEDIDAATIILPSKRAGGFFTNYLRKKIKKTSFLPKILSIEEFIESLADLKIIDNAQLILMSYDAYMQTTSIETKESFESYVSWIQTLLNDFDEIDRHLVDTDSFFDYLGSIKAIEKWSVNDEQTDLVKNYLAFWNSLPEFHSILQEMLLAKGLGYQGMVYRKATEELEHYIALKGTVPHIFIGFNALNKAEQHLIKELLETGNSEIHFDIDDYFVSQPDHSVSSFAAEYFDTWKYFGRERPKLPANFERPKSFHLIETQKSIAQAKYTGQLLSEMTSTQRDNTAIVLADENLLVPMLYSLPAAVRAVNVTMGVTLKNLPAALFFNGLLYMHHKQPEAFYYKDIELLLNNPVASLMLPSASFLMRQIAQENITFITLAELKSMATEYETTALELLFGNWKGNTTIAISNILALLKILNPLTRQHPIERIVLYELHTIFSRFEGYMNRFPHIDSIKSLIALFQEAASSTTIDFRGDAYSGLQIMGIGF